MHTIIKRIIELFSITLLILVVTGGVEVVAAPLMPTGEENVKSGDTGYWHIGKLERSRLYATESGYVRICYSDGKTLVEKYDNNLNFISKIFIDKQMDRWGGACYSEGMIFVVESNYVEVPGKDAVHIKISKYDMSGNLLGYEDIKRDGRYAFARSLDMCVYNGKLFIASDQAYEHTGLFLMEVDINTMTGRVMISEFNHSFKHYFTVDDSVYLQELKEGWRGVELSKVVFSERIGKNILSNSAIIFKYGGVRTTSEAIPCKADVNGLACSSNNVITVGESIDQSRYDEGDDLPWNLYITVTPKDNISGNGTVVKWLTNYNDPNNDVYSSSITKISNDRFLVAWENHQYGKVPTATDINDALSWGDYHYIFIDGDGNVISQEYTSSIPLSDCQPVCKNGKVVFYSSIGNMVTFYSIDANTGELIKKLYRVAGDYATWDVKGNTLVISGKGVVDINDEEHWIRDTQWIPDWNPDFGAWLAYWNPVFGSVGGEEIRRIIIKNGITSINDRSLTYFEKMEEIYIENGVKSIGDNNFIQSECLEKIYLPKSIKSIGKGFATEYDFGDNNATHYTLANIYAVKGSYASKYAKKHKIEYIEMLNSVNLKKAVRNNNRLTINWKPQKKVTGYQIEYSTDPDFVFDAKKIKIKGKRKSKKVISILKSDKTYYVRVRSYKNRYVNNYVYDKKKKKWKTRKEVWEVKYGDWSVTKVLQ